MSNFGELINSETPILVDFYAVWCGPCKTMGPILENVAEKMKGKVKVIKVDIDKNPEAAAQYRIQGVPTLILFQKGSIKWRQSGVVQFTSLLQVLESFL